MPGIVTHTSNSLQPLILFFFYFQGASYTLHLSKPWTLQVATSGKEPACQCTRHQETQVWFLGWEDPLGKVKATHSSVLAWRIPWTEEPDESKSCLHMTKFLQCIIYRYQSTFFSSFFEISSFFLWIFQARILQWVAFPFSRGSSQSRDQTQVSRIAGRFFTSWSTREAQEYWSG